MTYLHDYSELEDKLGMWTHLLIALSTILALLARTFESQTRGELLPARFSATFGNRKFKIFEEEKKNSTFLNFANRSLMNPIDPLVPADGMAAIPGGFGLYIGQ